MCVCVCVCVQFLEMSVCMFVSVYLLQDACSGRTSLHYAVEAENFILVNFLLESGCNVNSPTFSGTLRTLQTH